jgi:hypothetical protein
MPTGPNSHHDHHGLSSIGNLPRFAEEPDSVLSLSPLVGTEPSEPSVVNSDDSPRREPPAALHPPALQLLAFPIPAAQAFDHSKGVRIPAKHYCMCAASHRSALSPWKYGV